MKHATTLALALAAGALLASCVSTREPSIPEPSAVETQSVPLPRFYSGFADYSGAQPPAALAAVLDASIASGKAPAQESLPVYSDGVLSFAFRAPGAAKAVLWMSGLQGDDYDQMVPYGKDDWYWRSYAVPADRNVSYSYHSYDADGVLSPLIRDPVNAGVDPKPPYLNLWKPAGTSRLEYLEMPYLLPDRAKPESYTLDARRMLVWLPAGYDADSARRYPVIYMQDGQNAWDSSSANWGGWKADKVMDSLLAEGKAAPAIIVSIFNTGYRTQEYAGAGVWAAGGFSDAHARDRAIAEYYRDWCISVLKPAIDARYRTLADRADTAVVGSSYGGCIAIYWSLSRPDVFGRAAALSYAPGDEERADGGMTALARDTYLPALKKAGTPQPRIWLDCGESGLDAQLLPCVRALDEVLRGSGFVQGKDYHFESFPGMDHNEAAWYKRLPQILQFVLPPK